ncbi:hypothetical protein [Ruminococcus sp.]|nr:hypothetical protein [Ruminococcus sp.]
MMNGKKAIVLSIILVLIIVGLIVLKETGFLHEIKIKLDELIAPIKSAF